jgi:protein involved in polysaccharide export with SLBB domain
MRVRDLIPGKEAVVSRDYWLNRNQIVGLDSNIASLLNQQPLSGTRLSVKDLVEKKIKEDEDLTIADTVRRRRIELEAAQLIDPDRSLTDRQLLEAEMNSKLTGQQQQQRSTGPQQSTLNPAQRTRVPPARQRESADPTRLMNLIRPPIKEVNWDYAVIERISPRDLSTSLVPFNLGKAVLEADPQQNVLLRPGDVVTVFSKDDLQVSIARQTKFIRLEGEFSSPGVYQIQPGETLRQLLVRVGGFTKNAYVFGSEFTRESTRSQQEKNLQEALDRFERNMERFNITRSQSAGTAEDAATLTSQAESQRQLVSRLRQIRPTGRIVLEVPAFAKAADLPELPLEDGDRMFVPSRPSMVNVFGAVYTESSFIYRTDKKPKDYLAQAGGPTKSADKSSVYVLRADGSVISAQQNSFLFNSGDLGDTQIMPGDSIVVPEELDRTTLTRQLRDISQIFYQFGLGAAAIRVLKN